MAAHTLALGASGIAHFDACDSIATLRRLELQHNALSELDGAVFERATRLEELILFQNRLEALPALPPSLRVLDVTDNRLLSLPAPLPPSLISLKAGGNAIGAPALAGLSRLETLFLEDNALLDMDAVVGCVALRSLNVGNGPPRPGRPPGRNGLASVPSDLAALARLTSLDVSNNRLAALPASLPGALATLLAGGNALAELPASWPPALAVLSVERNVLAALPAGLAECPLRVLVASGNRLAGLPDALGTLPSLEVLHVDGNQIAALPEAAATGWPRLGEALFQENRLKALPASAAWPRLVSLYGRGNGLRALPSLAATARILELDGNKLSALPDDVACLSSLAGLFLGENALFSLPNELPASLRTLLVDGNRIGALPESLPPALRYLDAARNRLSTVAIARLPDLRMLGLVDNRMTSLVFPAPPPAELHTLLAGGNFLSSLDGLAGLKKLRLLGLHRNPFAAPPAGLAAVESVDADGAPALRDAPLLRGTLEAAAPLALDVCCAHGFRVDGNRVGATLYRGGDAAAAAALPATVRTVVINGDDATWPTDYERAVVDRAYSHGRSVFAQNLDRSALDGDRARRTTWCPLGLDLRATYDRHHRRRRHVLLSVGELDDARAVPRSGPDGRIRRVLVTWSRDSTTNYRFERRGYAARAALFDEALASGLAAVALGDRGRVWRAMGAHAFVASPVGAGFDCYRTWEGLFFGAIVIAQRSPLEAEFRAARLPVVFVDHFRFTDADLATWAAAHEPIASPDDPRLRRATYLTKYTGGGPG